MLVTCSLTIVVGRFLIFPTFKSKYNFMSKILISITLIALSMTLLFSCGSNVKKENLSAEKQAEFIRQGKLIVQQSAKALSAELFKALEQGGVQSAVGYCHLKASPITDSLSKAFEVRISRTSDKYRSPSNQPGDLDFTVMNAYKQQQANGKDLQAHLEVTGNKIIFYSPIVIQDPRCLLCHGSPGNTIEPASYDYILSKYPQDLATGYQLGDLRGVWKVEFLSR